MDPLYLQIQSDVDGWLGKSSILLQRNEPLKRLWEGSRAITAINPYFPIGVSSLRRYLKNSSPFKTYPEVQALVISDFDPETGSILSVGDVEDFVDSIDGVETPKIVCAFVEEIFRWIGTNFLFGNAYVLKDMWDRHHVGNTYADYGAPALVNTLQGSANFGECRQVRALNRGYFVGGGLKLVSDLRGYVSACPLPPTL